MIQKAEELNKAEDVNLKFKDRGSKTEELLKVDENNNNDDVKTNTCNNKELLDDGSRQFICPLPTVMKYEEEENAEQFFVPYLWSSVVILILNLVIIINIL